MTHEDLVELVRAHPAGGKLKRAIEKRMGWDRRGDDWYRNWEPWLASALASAFREAYGA